MRALILSFLLVAFVPSLAMMAQTARPTVRAGVGVLATDMHLKHSSSPKTIGEVIAPSLFAEYNHPLTQTLSLAIGVAAGHASCKDILPSWYESDSDMPFHSFEGIVSHNNHLTASAAFLFRPISWLEAGLGISWECVNSAHADYKYYSVNHYPYNEETHQFDRVTTVSYDAFSKAQTSHFGVIFPIKLHLYTNERYEVSAFYNMQYWHQKMGRWGKGTTYAGLTFGIKL